MSTELTVGLWLAAAYLIGAIPFGFIIGKLRGVDVRTVGSKNIGATNVFRTVGKKWGVLALVLDMMKGFLPTLACKLTQADAIAWLPLSVGIMTAVGHMLTPYMKFKGGKGVATGFGMMIALIPCHCALAFGIFALVFAMSNYISLGSCTAAAFLGVSVWVPVGSFKGYGDLPQAILITFVAAFVIYKHRANIQRLLAGNENKIYLFKKPETK
ncbi:MAG: glycerol-3-phosphate 1-O-acyltransferase PlsY [Kiritimatiellae bacterium]|nr:glycerol-3-phosphate 1-O-acyltransferase PlsY [Kiritimatiellia bacterium]